MLKSLKEFNAERWKLHESQPNFPAPRPNGIACPECGAELLDSCPNIVLTSNPPQKNMYCGKCSYRGFRLA